jgi:hypothetical protein
LFDAKAHCDGFRAASAGITLKLATHSFP